MSGARRILAAVTFAAAIAACAPLQGRAPAPTPIPSTDVQIGWDKVGSTIVMTVGQTLLMPTSMTPFNDVLTVVGRYRGGTVFRAANAGRTSLYSDYSRPNCGGRPCAQLMQISVQVVVVRTLNDPYSPSLIDTRSRTWLWIAQRILITTRNSTDPSGPAWVSIESEQPGVIAPEGSGNVTAEGATRAFRAVRAGPAAIAASTTDPKLDVTWSFTVIGHRYRAHGMHAYEIPQLDPQPRDADGHGYVDFLASDRLSVGLAVWPARSVDRQRPHAEDEVYYVISGRGRIVVGGEDRSVQPGSLVFVAAGIEHRFHDIEEDLRVLVFWSPPHVRRS